MPYVITDACVDIMDRSCVAQCPVECIHEGARMLYINPDDCIDCGACEPVCPQNAIHLAAMLPPELSAFQDINAEFFDSAEHGPANQGGRDTGIDHPAIAALPRRHHAATVE